MTKKAPSLKQLEYFVAVADSPSLRRAADRLGVSQPTLSAQIGALEDTLGVRLFERSRSGVLLSPMGRQLIPNARRVLEEVQGFVEASALGSRRPGGTFRLGVTPTLGPYVLPHVLPDLHSSYAELRFYVREAAPRQLEIDLADGRQDLILTSLPLTSREFTVAPVFREPIWLVLPEGHPLGRLSAITPSDLGGVDVLTIEEHHLFHRQVRDLCERFGARLLPDYEGTSLDALRQMVLMGMGVAFLPALYVKSEIRAHTGLQVVTVVGESMERLHALVWRPSSPARGFFQQVASDVRWIMKTKLGEVVTVVR